MIQSRAHVFSCQPHGLHNPAALRPPHHLLFLTPLFALVISCRPAAGCSKSNSESCWSRCDCACRTGPCVALICMCGVQRDHGVQRADTSLHLPSEPAAAAHAGPAGTAAPGLKCIVHVNVCAEVLWGTCCRLSHDLSPLTAGRQIFHPVNALMQKERMLSLHCNHTVNLLFWCCLRSIIWQSMYWSFLLMWNLQLLLLKRSCRLDCVC